MPALPISRTDAVRQLLALALEGRKKGKKRKGSRRDVGRKS